MKKLPIGVQQFPKMRSENYLYIDKTEVIYRLISSGSYYFLSRPRRFGKSLLISTLQEIFLGHRELFEGLWIYDKLDWQPRPVILLDFSKISHKTLGLEQALHIKLDELAQEAGIHYDTPSYSSKFSELIKKIAHQEQVVILIDEYDKPIIDHIENIKQATANREILKNLYSVVKGNDRYIKFFMITGISKFTRVSIFSDLNNLSDITLNSKYTYMLGYTEAEIEHYFDSYMPQLQEKYAHIYGDVKQVIREWYNGYSWDGETFVYNPFSILNLFDNLRFEDYWFQTGTPTFLMKLIKQKQYTIFDLEKRKLNLNFFNKYDLAAIDINSLLFQTGYLTFKHFNLINNVVTLDFPNKEVAQSFSAHLLAEFNQQSTEQTGSLLYQMEEALNRGKIEKFMALMETMFANIAYPNIDAREKYYHSIFYLALKLLGYSIESEVLTHDGRIDAVLQTADYLYVIEFKVGEAQTALAQIKAKEYHLKYRGTNKQVILLGIGFDSERKNIGDFLSESVSGMAIK